MPRKLDEAKHLANLNREVEKYEKALKNAQLKRDAFLTYMSTIGVEPSEGSAAAAAQTNPPKASSKGGNPAATSSQEKPSLKDALTEIMLDGEVWTATNLKAELERRGWLPESSNPVDHIRSCLASYFFRVDHVRGGYTAHQPSLSPVKSAPVVNLPPVVGRPSK